MAVPGLGDPTVFGCVVLGDFDGEEVAVDQLVHGEGSKLQAGDRQNAPHGEKKLEQDAQGKASIGDKVVEGETAKLVLAD